MGINRISVFLVVLLTCKGFCCDNNPQISVINSENQAGNEDKDKVIVGDKVSQVFELNATVGLQCLSDKPVEWLFHGHSNKPNLVKIHRQRNCTDFNKESTCCYLTSLVIPSMKEESIGKYICKTTIEPLLRSEFYMYLSDEDKAPYYLQAGTKLTVQSTYFDNEVIIPCPVSRPSSQFYVIDSRRWRPPELPFDPQVGFKIDARSNKEYYGSYKCVYPGMEKEETDFVDVEVLQPVDYIIYPKTEVITANPGFVVKCASAGEVKMTTTKHSGDVQIMYDIKPENSFRYIATFNYSEVPDGESGEISCLRSNKRNIFTWKYKKVSKGCGLSVDTKNHIICRSNSYSSPLVSAVFCNTPDQCSIARNCVKGLNSETGNYYFESAEPSLSEESCGEGCYQIKALKSGGVLVNCTADDFTSVDTFVIALDKKIYSNWNKIPVHSLVETTVSSHSANIGDRITGECRWLSFLFSKSMQWAVKLENKSILSIDKRNWNVSDNTEVDGSMHSKVDFVVEEHGIVALLCYVSWWNSSEWIVSIQSLNPEELVESDFTDEQIPKKEVIENFTEDSFRKTLEIYSNELYEILNSHGLQPILLLRSLAIALVTALSFYFGVYYQQQQEKQNNADEVPLVTSTECAGTVDLHDLPSSSSNSVEETKRKPKVKRSSRIAQLQRNLTDE